MTLLLHQCCYNNVVMLTLLNFCTSVRSCDHVTLCVKYPGILILLPSVYRVATHWLGLVSLFNINGRVSGVRYFSHRIESPHVKMAIIIEISIIGEIQN